MRALLYSLILALSLASAGAQEFARNFPPEFKLVKEKYRDEVRTSDGTSTVEAGGFYELKITGRVSMVGIDKGQFDENTEFDLQFGDLVLGTKTLGQDPDYDKGESSARIPLTEQDSAGGAVVGYLLITWTSAEMNFTLEILDQVEGNDFATYSPVALAIAGDEDPEFASYPSVSVTFAGRMLEGRVVYVTGTARVTQHSPSGEFINSVDLIGGIDSKVPAVNLINPTINVPVRERPVQIRGTASDENGIQSVQVDVNGLGFRSATINAAGEWSIAWSDGLIATAPRNVVTVRVTDQDENVSEVKGFFTYLSKSNLTVSAEGPGRGRVIGAFLKPSTTLNYPALPGKTFAPSVTVVNENTVLTVVAAPLAGSVFDGWVSNKSLPSATSPNAIAAHNPRLVFTMQPLMNLTARFIPNPFSQVSGVYGGLATSGSTPARGFFQGTVNAAGYFTSYVRLGLPGQVAVVVPIRGQMTNDFQFPPPWNPALGQIRVGARVFTVAVRAETAEDGSKRLLGTLSGGGFESVTFGGDIASFKSKPLTNRLPVEETGYYNAVIPPAAGAPTGFPVGHGAGRLYVNGLGYGRFVGRLGDGTVVSVGATLSKNRTFPFYAYLYAGKGYALGTLSLNRTTAPFALGGLVEWARPALPTAVLFPAGFAGQSELIGARWTVPGPLVNFMDPDGKGVLRIDAPAATLKLRTPVVLPAKSSTDNVTFDPTKSKLTIDPPVNPADPLNPRKIVPVIVPSTGYFYGYFRDDSFTPARTLVYRGFAVPGVNDGQGVAAGYFIRGDQTGSVVLDPIPIVEPS